MCDPSFVEDDYGLLLDDEPFQDNDEDEDFEPVAVVSKSSKSKKKSKPKASLPGKAKNKNKNKKRGRNAKQNFEDSQHFPRQGHYSSPKEENLSPLDSSVANSPASSPPSDDSPELLPKRKREIQTTTKRGKKRTRRGNDEQAEALLLADEEEAFNVEQQFNSNWRPRRDRRQTQRLGNELFQEISECTDETVHQEVKTPLPVLFHLHLVQTNLNVGGVSHSCCSPMRNLSIKPHKFPVSILLFSFLQDQKKKKKSNQKYTIRSCNCKASSRWFPT